MSRLWPLCLMLLLVGCSEQSEQPVEPPPSLADPVAVELDADGRPVPDILAESQVIHRGNGEEPQTLDPHLAEGVPSTNILRDLFEGLTTTTPDGHIVPGAAQHWDISRDGLTYTFFLDPEGRWSNGEPVTAEDFVWSWQRAVDPSTGASYGRMLSPVANAEAIFAGELPPEELGVTALNDSTFQVDLNHPSPYFLGLLTHPTTYPVYREAVEAYGDSHVRPGNLVSNGAYTLEEWRVRSSITLVKNRAYRAADDVIVERVVFYPLEDENTEFNRFRAGDLHWTYQVPSNRFQWLRENLDEALMVTPWFGTYFFSFNLTRPPFKDNLALRQALNLAVDREILTERVSRFGEIPTFNLVPPGLPEYEPPVTDWADMTQKEREDEARRLYREAGYSEEKPLAVELRYNASENHRKIAVAIAAMWKQVLGVRTRLINEEFRVFLQNRAQRRVTEVFRSGWIGDYQDAFTFLELFHSEHGRNDAGYDNPRFDRLLERIAAERVPASRRNLMAEAERMILADQVILPVYNYVTKRLIDPRLKGWKENVMDHHLTRYMYLVRAREAGEEEDAAEEAEGEES
ncbi:peptide ABC transporter substrate-binding protein [Wenzhouxiangella sp. 15181]|uniref:peptide ABC transporter substrate-binding protein n=1 Tax=Wenzhouxiangella sp. 15181 TaxID=2301224 RepID=UPI000E329232|nr:peptide ABC transporter substrate-binding protein [Wenzhouxiangella sp. 15181]RFF26246.1 peptide ABC transporter substrate-binding protein [Wenzhouxiangella sp. 15181]RFP68242.1 peptide ABC transporter substrate-binding protein [Wenzhouxiangella sp. 15190]